MNRVEVLDRVGGLLLLPDTELATTKQVAEFYGVDREVIRQVVQRNSEELESNGRNDSDESSDQLSTCLNLNALQVAPEELIMVEC